MSHHSPSPLRTAVLGAIAAACVAPLLVTAAHAQPAPGFHNPALPTSERVADLVKQMTLDEKVSQMMDQAPAIPRLGIPEYNWWNEGLHGIARSGYATVFPQAIGMAATFDTALIGREADVVATEARAKYNRAIAHDNHARYYGLTVWSPNINIFRDPRWGRGQETYGEDPYLTGTLGGAFVRGLQDIDPKLSGSPAPGPGSSPNRRYYKAIATPKHFAVHSGPESTRHKANVDPSPFDLESTYLPAFRATIVDAKAGSLMCAYNAINGTPACANTMLLGKTLRDAWGFKGFVTSDCGAIHDFFDGHNTSPDAEHAAAAAVLAGTDTNCGFTYRALIKAVHGKLLPESAIDTAVKRLFTARIELGMFDPVQTVPYNSIPFIEDDSAAHRSLALSAAQEAMVLLRNEHQTLPLKPGLKTIAVVGPNAASLLALEGNYNAIPSHPVLPVDGLSRQFPTAKLLYAQGSPYAEGAALPVPRTALRTPAGQPGLTGAYYASADGTGKPALQRTDPQVDFDWTHASPVLGLGENSYLVRWTGTLTPPAPGAYQFSLKVSRCEDPCPNHQKDTEQLSVSLDGKPVQLAGHRPGTDQWSSATTQLDLHFADTKPHPITIEYRHQGANTAGGISFRWQAPVAAELAEAAAAAQQADVTIAVIGLNSELEGEEMPVELPGFAGGDRTRIDLPGAQQALLERLGAVSQSTGKPLVVVLENGSALAVNWAAAHADAILEAWYPGEAGGTAIAQTLAGKSNPGGKLPVTFYSDIGELPPFDDYSMHNRTYRYYSGKPLYGFGYGLSYTSFSFSGLKLSAPTVQAGQPLTVEAEVRNTGRAAGDEVAELYLMPPQAGAGVETTRLQLVGFARVSLKPGQSRHVQFSLAPRQLSVVDKAGHRAMRAGEYTLHLGGGQPDASAPGLSASFTIAGEQELPK